MDVPNNLLAEGGAVGKFIVSRYYATASPMPLAGPLPDFALGGTAREGVDYTATKQATSRVVPPIAQNSAEPSPLLAFHSHPLYVDAEILVLVF